MTRIIEPIKEIPVIEDVDICVIGGSCTGVFAAIRAARLGARVVIIEKQNSFGGVATQGLVNVWHSLYDTEKRIQIIGGLTEEVLKRLEKRQAVLEKNAPCGHFILNTEELKIDLDEMISEHKNITPFFHTYYTSPFVEEGHLTAVIIENKDGRQAIKAKVFIDASGDGDLSYNMGIPFTLDKHLQPPTTCAKISNLCPEGVKIKELIKAHREEFNLERDSGWSGNIPGCDDAIRMHAETHVFNTNAADAKALTQAEIEGRRQIRAVMDIIRKYEPSQNMSLISLASYIGIRETRRFHGEYQLSEEDVLFGRDFEDTIGNGSYVVDIHNPVNGGFVFKYLDGTQVKHDFYGSEKGRWRPETEENPTYYQIPYRTMINRHVDNLILAGRTISTDKGAFGAVRVMVNLNQTGEAAGVAAWLALDSNHHVYDIDTVKLQKLLIDGGSIIK